MNLEKSEIPLVNQRIKKIIDTNYKGSVRALCIALGFSDSQKINRLFNIDSRNGKYPTPSIDILNLISNKLDISLAWLQNGEGSMLKSETQPAKAPKVSYGAHIKNLFSDLTDEDIESLIAGEFAKHLLEMYEEGRAYPAIYVSQLRDEITAAQRRIIELEKEIEVIKSQKQ